MKKLKIDDCPHGEIEYTREMHDKVQEEIKKREAIRILIADGICSRPILSCAQCPRYKNGDECKAPTDAEVEFAVEYLHEYLQKCFC